MLFKDLSNNMKPYRVWWCFNGIMSYYYLDEANIIDNAITVISVLSIRDLADESVDCNMSGLEVFEDTEWCEYYDENGKDIKDIIDEREEENE